VHRYFTKKEPSLNGSLAIMNSSQGEDKTYFVGTNQ
jgi:hypothetical protein